MNPNRNPTAFGAPGIEPRWTSSAKEGLGTAYRTSCRMSLLQGPHVPLGPKQVLHMVTVLVGDHVGLRKISALRKKALLQLAEETQIQVHLLIRRTIERARLGASGSAATVGFIAEKDQFRGMVPRPFARQFPVPECLNIGLDADDELARIVLRVDPLAASRRASWQPRVLRFRFNRCPALALLDDATDLTCGLVPKSDRTRLRFPTTAKPKPAIRASQDKPSWNGIFTAWSFSMS